MNKTTLDLLMRLVQGYAVRERPSTNEEMASYVNSLPPYEDSFMQAVIKEIMTTATSPFLPHRPEFVQAAKNLLVSDFTPAEEAWAQVLKAAKKGHERGKEMLEPLVLEVIENTFTWGALVRADNIFMMRKQFIEAYRDRVEKEVLCQLRTRSAY